MRLRKKPSERPKHKYIVFRVHSSGSIRYNDLRNAITNELINWMGEKDFAEAGIRLIKNLYHDGKGFIRCLPGYVDSVKMSLALIHQIGDERVIFQTVRVSGTIKSGKKRLGIRRKER